MWLPKSVFNVSRSPWLALPFTVFCNAVKSAWLALPLTVFCNVVKSAWLALFAKSSVVAKFLPFNVAVPCNVVVPVAAPPAVPAAPTVNDVVAVTFGVLTSAANTEDAPKQNERATESAVNFVRTFAVLLDAAVELRPDTPLERANSDTTTNTLVTLLQITLYILFMEVLLMVKFNQDILIYNFNG